MSNTTKELFTQGDFIVENFSRSNFEKVFFADGKKIFHIDLGYLKTIEEADAYLHVLSQAKNMYYALRDIIEWYKGGGNPMFMDEKIIDNAESVLQKATHQQ